MTQSSTSHMNDHWRSIVEVIITSSALFVIGCSSEPTITEIPDEVSQVELIVAQLSIPVGGTSGATATPRNDLGDALTARGVTWQSSNSAIASVEGSGLAVNIRGVSVGTARITATSEGKEATRDVTITAPGFVQLAGGAGHTCGITSVSKAYCWGTNFQGRLGNGSNIDSKTPVEVRPTGQGFSAIVTGTGHTCGLVNGQAYCWGNNDSGQLGDGTTTDRNQPTQVTTNLTFASMTAGVSHTCALTAAGKAYCWGSGVNGRLGHGSTNNSAVPVAVSSDSAFAGLVAGGYHTCGVTRAAGRVLCWGLGDNGQLGTGAFFVSFSTPQPIRNTMVPQFVSSISAGESHTCAINNIGKAYCWGVNYAGQLGDGSNVLSNEPTAVRSDSVFTALVGGIVHTCGITRSGKAYCWGANDRAQLGTGNTAASLAPAAVSGSLVFASLAAGAYHTCGVVQTRAYCWGDNFYGQIGDGGTVNQPVPKAVSGF
jgi:alpha-tubulin suppressor-like RCC1 family protein